MGEFGDRRGGPGATVLVVDDDPEVTELYVTHLREYYDVRTVTSGQDALDQVDDDVDVVLLDRRMPDTSGDEVLERIREAGYDCRVVVVTAVDPDFDVVDMPFDEYLTKPVDSEVLVDAVERQILLDSYHSRFEEFLRMRAKLDVLEAQKDQVELDASDRYNELAVVAESLREDLQEMIDRHEEIDPVDLESEGLDRS